jgi:hypothetical protein
MGEREARDIQGEHEQIAVQEVAGKVNKLDGRETLHKIIDCLQQENGFYHWVEAYGEIDGKAVTPVWLLRSPRDDLGEEANWLKKEAVKVLHVCRPLQLLEAIVTNDKERTIAHSGYVHDDDFNCVRCKTVCPEVIQKVFENFQTLHKLKQSQDPSLRGGGDSVG